MTSLRQDLTYALRMLGKAPGFTALAVLVLAVGIGANSAMFSVVNALLLRPLWGAGGEVVGVYSRDRTVPDSYRAFSYPNYVDIRDSGVFKSLMAQSFAIAGTPAGDGTRRMLAAVVSSNYFETLGVTLAAGRPFSTDEERPGVRPGVAIVPYAAWDAAGRTPDFIGRTIRINSSDYTIVGVTPRGFTGTMAVVSPEVFLPLSAFDAIVSDQFKNNGRGLGDRGNAGLVLAGRITPGLDHTAVQSRLNGLAERLAAEYPAENRNQELSIHRLSRLNAGQAPTDNTAIATFTGFLMLLSGIVLVIACLNLANMLLARGAARRKELAVRIALGAARSRVVRQLLTESALLAGAGATIGLVFSYWATRTFASSLASGLPFNVNLSATPDVAVLAVTIACATLGTIAFGLGPALGLSRRDLIADLRDRSGDGSRTGRGVNVRNALVAAQIALSLTLLTAGGIFARTTTHAAAGRPGYSYDHLILGLADTRLAGVEDARIAPIYQEVLARVRATPGVTAASVASTVPFGDSQDGRSMERVGPSDRGPVRARSYRVVGADYFRMLGLSMRRGREFTAIEESSSAAPAVAIIDDVLARELFDGVDPIGQMIRVPRDPRDPGSVAGEPMEIVGIAPPLREEMLEPAPVSHVYVPSGRNIRSGMHVQLRLADGADERAALDGLRAHIHAVNAAIPILRLTSMQAFHDASLELWALRATAYAFTLLGALAMLLAAVGVYGVRAYTVALRTREFGIRMALGASPGRVLGLVLRDGAMLTAVGLAIGLPLGLLVSLGLRSVFVDVGGIDLVVLTAAMLVLAIAATLAGAVPARRATRIEPVKALSAE